MFGFGVLGAMCDGFLGTDTCGVGDAIGELGFSGDDFGYHSADDLMSCGIDSSSAGSSCDWGGTAWHDTASAINFDASTMGFQSWIDTPGLWSDPGVGGFDGMGGGTAFSTDWGGMD